MKLNSIKIDQLSDPDVNLTNSFIEIPFLYTPVLKELKRKESVIKKLCFTINSEMLQRYGVLLSILRLFDIPEKLDLNKNNYLLTYSDKTIEIEFTNSGLIFSGFCQLQESNLIFSENMPYIKIELNSGKESIIVLPEGDGYFYMNLDKKESEDDNRVSIIGKPDYLHKCYSWMMETLND